MPKLEAPEFLIRGGDERGLSIFDKQDQGQEVCSEAHMCQNYLKILLFKKYGYYILSWT